MESTKEETKPKLPAASKVAEGGLLAAEKSAPEGSDGGESSIAAAAVAANLPVKNENAQELVSPPIDSNKASEKIESKHVTDGHMIGKPEGSKESINEVAHENPPEPSVVLNGNDDPAGVKDGKIEASTKMDTNSHSDLKKEHKEAEKNHKADGSDNGKEQSSKSAEATAKMVEQDNQKSNVGTTKVTTDQNQPQKVQATDTDKKTAGLQSIGTVAAQAIKQESKAEKSSTGEVVKRKVPPKKDNGKSGKTAYTPYNQLDIKAADVLLGRGKRATMWDGNVRYKKLIRSYVPAYVRAEKNRDKTLITIRIVEHVHMLGGRFLKEDLKTGELSEVTDDVARLKVGQALRHRMRMLESGEDSEEEGLPEEAAASSAPKGSLGGGNGNAFAIPGMPSSKETGLLSKEKRTQFKFQQPTAKVEPGTSHTGGNNGHLHVLLEALKYDQSDGMSQKKNKTSLLDGAEDTASAVDKATSTPRGIAQLPHLSLYQNQGEGISLSGFGRPTREELQMAGLLKNANNIPGNHSVSSLQHSYSTQPTLARGASLELQRAAMMAPPLNRGASLELQHAAMMAPTLNRGTSLELQQAAMMAPPLNRGTSLELQQAAMMAPSLSRGTSVELRQAAMMAPTLNRGTSRELQQAMMAPALNRGTSLEQTALRNPHRFSALAAQLEGRVGTGTPSNEISEQELQHLRLLASRSANPYSGLDQQTGLVGQQDKRPSFDPMLLAGRRPSATTDDMDMSLMAARVADEARIQQLLRAQSLLNHNSSERDQEVSAIQRQLAQGQHLSQFGRLDDSTTGLTLQERQLLTQLQSQQISQIAQQQGDQGNVGGLVRRLLEKKSTQTNLAHANSNQEAVAVTLAQDQSLQQNMPMDQNARVAAGLVAGIEQKPTGSAIPQEVANLMRQYPEYFKDQYMPNGADIGNKGIGQEHLQQGAQGTYGTKRSRGDLLGLDDESDPEAVAKRSRETYGNGRLGYAFANPVAPVQDVMKTPETIAIAKKDPYKETVLAQLRGDSTLDSANLESSSQKSEKPLKKRVGHEAASSN